VISVKLAKKPLQRIVLGFLQAHKDIAAKYQKIWADSEPHMRTVTAELDMKETPSPNPESQSPKSKNGKSKKGKGSRKKK
jgi:hypothetical protein